MSHPTNSIGRGKVNLSVTVTNEERDAIDVLAQRSGMSGNEYCLHILQSAIEAAPEFSTHTKVTLPSESDLPEDVRRAIYSARRK